MTFGAGAMREGTGHDAVPGDPGPGRDAADSPEAESPATRQPGSPFHSAPVFLSELAGPDLVIVSATPGTGPALGTGDATLTGRRLADVVRDPEGRHLVEAIRRVYTTGNHAHDVRWRTPSGGQADEPDGADFSLSVLPVRQPDGSVSGVAVAGLARASPLRATGGRDAEAGDAVPAGLPDPAGTDEAAGSAVPAGLPVLPRVRLAARYLPARQDPGASDAWIDALVLPQRVIALMTGTVGHRFACCPRSRGAAAEAAAGNPARERGTSSDAVLPQRCCRRARWRPGRDGLGGPARSGHRRTAVAGCRTRRARGPRGRGIRRPARGPAGPEAWPANAAHHDRAA